MRFALCSAAVVAAFLTGCNQSPEGGGPGTNDKFTVTAPTLTTNIKQGDKQSIKISVDRGKDFKQGVKFEAKPTDKVKADFAKSNLAASETGDAMMTVTVDKDAPLGEHIIKVTATPDNGAATSVDVKVNVEKNP